LLIWGCVIVRLVQKVEPLNAVASSGDAEVQTAITISTDDVERAKPILRWVGGKTQILKNLLSLLPSDINRRHYIEPFLGAGALFFAIKPRSALVSDSNRHLMQMYMYVRDNPEEIAKCLAVHASRSTEEYYYQIREIYNRESPSPAQAARFIYLNKSCFNGIFRVNRSDEFNVPYGRKEPPFLPSEMDLRAVADSLRSATLKSCDFEEALEDAETSAFIYLDPPYPSLDGAVSFVRYTPSRFYSNDHIRLAKFVQNLDTKGCLVMVSNADTPLVRRLYRGFNLTSISVIRHVTCKGEMNRASELVITNY